MVVFSVYSDAWFNNVQTELNRAHEKRHRRNKRSMKHEKGKMWMHFDEDSGLSLKKPLESRYGRKSPSGAIGEEMIDPWIYKLLTGIRPNGD